jgi:hypothetical protein
MPLRIRRSSVRGRPFLACDTSGASKLPLWIGEFMAVYHTTVIQHPVIS